MSSLNKFIEDELILRNKHYKEAPASIIEHYNIEQQNIQAYNGRQLLEMLQNADDVSENAKEKKVLIKLNENELVIANNGEPFSEDGFRSIIYSNLSPKTMQQNKIGQKGLGFRSILSWADEVIINSGGTKLGFSEKIAQKFLENLIKDSPEVSDFIKRHSNSISPIATLRVPELLNGINDSIKNFDTTISIKLKDNILDDVQSQILSVINKETLIFLNHIEIIEIDSPKRKSILRKNISGSKITVECKDFSVDSLVSNTWHVKRINGIHKSKNYELAIAWNDELNDNENVLFSYFKTQVRFPFPALLHGTFELTQDRNQLVNDTEGHNKFLTEKLAELLIDTALYIASQNQEINYLPLKLLNIEFDKIDSVLSNFDFKQKLIEKIKASEIFPNVNGKYISYENKPVYYDYPIAKFLKGDDVDNLLKHTDEESLVKFINSFSMFYYALNGYIQIISQRKDNKKHLSILIYHLLTCGIYKNILSSPEFNLLKQPEFLLDTESNHIPWNVYIFIQPQDKREFKLPKSLNLRFINPELINFILQEFQKKNVEFVIDELKPFNVKKYSFSEIVEILILHYYNKENLTANDVTELHSYLFHLYKSEAKEKGPPELLFEIQIPVPVISAINTVRKASEIYFGKHYGKSLTEQLYSFDKSKLLAGPQEYGFEEENSELVRKYFEWFGVADMPRYIVIVLQKGTYEYNEYKEHLLRNYDYKKPLEAGEGYKDYNHLKEVLWSVSEIKVGYFDDFNKILAKANSEIIFEWIKCDDRLRKTLEENCETLPNTEAALEVRGKHNYRYIRKHNLRSYTRWLFFTTVWLPIEAESRKSAPDKCCLSKTITSDFSPFVEKPKIDVASISEKLEVSEDVIENYLVFVGVHREISSFSIVVLYEMLSYLSSSDKEGKVAKLIYREIISNFNETKLDISHPNYQEFIKDGKILCQKGNETGYFPVGEAYYIETKTLGNNILKRFPLVCIDRKKGKLKVTRLFGVKPLENISFKILGEPIIHPLNYQFNEEIHRFKGLIYVLRMHQDTKHEILNRLKRLNITLAQDVKAEFTHNQQTENYELNKYEFIGTKNKSTFHILIPSDVNSMDELRQNISFSDSIAEMFTTLINTEDHRSFIRELFSTREIDRETLLQSEMQEKVSDLIIEAKNQLEIIDDIRLSFWRAFSIASEKNIKTEIRNETELNTFLEKKLELQSEKLLKLSALETFTQLTELSNQEFLYELFLDFKIDYKSFARHFSGLDFINLFKYNYADLKTSYSNDFAFHLFNKLSSEIAEKKGEYFKIIDDYNDLRYNIEDGFLSNIKQHFKNEVSKNFSINLQNQGSDFSFQKKINENLLSLTNKEIIIPEIVKEKRNIQAFLLFNDEEEIKKIIAVYNSANQNLKIGSNSNQIKVRETMIEYDSFQSLAQKVLDGLDISKLKLKTSKTLPVEDGQQEGKQKSSKSKTRNVRFNTKNEEQIGFIAEVICYEKLCSKYGEENINWVSENAYRAYPEKFITGEAGKGYDLELTENGKVRYIEIKGTSNINEGIHMTAEEIKTALDFPEKYDLLIVENPLSSEPFLRHVKAPFKFKKEESLLSNDKLKIYNDNYIIKFIWDE